MERKEGNAPTDPRKDDPGVKSDVPASQVGDLGKGSHEQTQSGPGAPTDLPGDERP